MGVNSRPGVRRFPKVSRDLRDLRISLSSTIFSASTMDSYQTPLSRCVYSFAYTDLRNNKCYSRYASKEMSHLFSNEVDSVPHDASFSSLELFLLEQLDEVSYVETFVAKSCHRRKRTGLAHT